MKKQPRKTQVAICSSPGEESAAQRELHTPAEILPEYAADYWSANTPEAQCLRPGTDPAQRVRGRGNWCSHRTLNTLLFYNQGEPMRSLK